METILLKILEVQQEMLAELRLMRQALTRQQPVAVEAARTRDVAPPHPAPAPAQQQVTPAPTPEPTPETKSAPVPEYTEPPRRPQPSAMLTLNELTDLGGQFLEPDQRPRSRVKPVDASDLGGSILDEIKAKNKAKRSAFADFEKFGRDR